MIGATSLANVAPVGASSAWDLTFSTLGRRTCPADLGADAPRRIVAIPTASAFRQPARNVRCTKSISPDLARGGDDQTQLGPLILFGNFVPFDRAGESTLRAQAHVLE